MDKSKFPEYLQYFEKLTFELHKSATKEAEKVL